MTTGALSGALPKPEHLYSDSVLNSCPEASSWSATTATGTLRPPKLPASLTFWGKIAGPTKVMSVCIDSTFKGDV